MRGMKLLSPRKLGVLAPWVSGCRSHHQTHRCCVCVCVPSVKPAVRRSSLKDRAKFAGLAAAISLASVRYAPGGPFPAVAFTETLGRALQYADVAAPLVPTVCFEVGS